MRCGRIFILAALVVLAGCGREGPTLPPTDKRVPALEFLYEGRGLSAWKAVPAEAPAEERASAAWALAALETVPAESEKTLLRLLRDEDASVCLAAVVAAGRLAPTSTEVAVAVVRFFDVPEEPLRRHARQAAGQLGLSAVEPLTEALAHEKGRVRWAALRALSAVGPAASSSVPLVARLARTEPDPSIRRQALFTLPHLGPAGVEAGLFFLRARELVVRHEAAAGLAQAGQVVAAPVARRLGDEDEEVAALAAGILADLGGLAVVALGDRVRQTEEVDQLERAEDHGRTLPSRECR